MHWFLMFCVAMIAAQILWLRHVAAAVTPYRSVFASSGPSFSFFILGSLFMRTDCNDYPDGKWYYLFLAGVPEGACVCDVASGSLFQGIPCRYRSAHFLELAFLYLMCLSQDFSDYHRLV